jgi:hypothetical protein
MMRDGGEGKNKKLITANFPQKTTFNRKDRR